MSNTIQSQNTELLTQIIDSFDDTIFWKNTRGEYLGCNKAYINKLYRDNRLTTDIKSIIGLNDFDLFAKENAQTYQQNDKEVIESAKPISFYERSYSNDKVDYHLLSHKFPLFENNEVCGVMGRVYDFSYIMVAGEKIRLTYRELQVYASHYFGMTAKEAAKYLNISNKTIEMHLASIKNKLNCLRRSELITIVKANKLEEPFQKIVDDFN